MWIVTDDALLRPCVIGDHDLTLLQRPSRHPLMAEGAKLSRVCRDDHFDLGRVIGAGRRNLEHAAHVALSGGAMADLAFDDLSDVGAVVHPFGPFGDLLRVA